MKRPSWFPASGVTYADIAAGKTPSVLRGCARCGGDHPIAKAIDPLARITARFGLVWRPLTRPIPDPDGDFTHWSPCPTNGEPILMRITQAE